MPKKSVNKAYITDPTKTRYEGFVEDIADLTELTNNLNLENRIDEVLGQVTALRDGIAVPAEEGSKQSVQRTALTQLVDQLEKIKEFAHNLAAQTTEKRSSLNTLINWENPDPDGGFFFQEMEHSYDFSAGHLMDLVNDSIALFCGGQATGFPKSIKRNLDTYNLTDGYREFTTENSVMAKVDQILTDASKLYTRSMKIASKNTRHKTEKRIESQLDYEKQNLEEYGKLCFNMPDYSLKNANDQFIKAFKEKEDNNKAEKEAEKLYKDAQKELSELNLKRIKLIGEGPAEQEKKKKAKADYDHLSALAEKYKSIKDTLEGVTFKKEYPDLKKLDAAAGKKYSSYQELLAESKGNMDQLALGESDTKQQVDKINSDINHAIQNSNDTRLKSFVDNESARYAYLHFPRFAREIRAKIAALPKNMQISCDMFNIIQINHEIDLKIKEKKGDNSLWFVIKGMLSHAQKFCPGEFKALPLTEQVIADCEKRGKAFSEDLDKDELHVKIRQYNELKDHAIALEEEIMALKQHDSKDKAFWTKENKALLKDKNTELKKVRSDIELLKKDKIYVEGASSVDKLLKKSINLSSSVFDLSVYQVDVYLDMMKTFAEGKKEYDAGVYMAQQEIVTQLTDIYESVPEDSLRVHGQKNTSKKDTPLKIMLDKMRTTKDPDAFRQAYKIFTDTFSVLKETYNDKGLKLVTDRVKASEEILKDTNYEDRLQEYNEKILASEEKLNTAKADYEQKKEDAERSRRNYSLAMTNVQKNGRFFERKQAAESFDASNEALADAKYDIDKNGDRFFMLIRQPFNEYFARKDYAKKKKHGDSDEYTNMINRLTAIVELRDDASIAQYKRAITDLKTFAQTYVRVREEQFFISKKNPMRKFRLSFAKGLIGLCDDQLQNLDGSERSVQLHPEVDKYLQRTAKINVRHLNKKETEDAKKAYNDSLDARRKEAIKAYKNSAEYKAKQAYEETEFKKELANIEKSLEDAEDALARVRVLPGTQNLIEPVKKNIDRLKKERGRVYKEYQIKRLQAKLDSDELTEDDKAALREFLQKVINNEIDLPAPDRVKKQPEKKQINIINNEEDVKEEKEIKKAKSSQKKPKKKSLREMREEEERQIRIDEQLERINKPNDTKKKPVVKENIINNNIINQENRQDLNSSFDSIKGIDAQIEEAMNPIHFENAEKLKQTE